MNVEPSGATFLNGDPHIANDTIAHHWYVGGEVINATRDIYTYQITPSGNTSWRRSIDGIDYDDDAATGIAVNGIGEVYVCAATKNTSGSYNNTTIKLGQTPVYLPVNYNFVPDTFSFSNLFYPNTGEIIDTSGAVADSVRFYTRFTYPTQFILKDRVAFCEVKQDTSATPSDTTSRVDMIFKNCNVYAEPSAVNTQTSSVLNYFLTHTGSGGITGVQGASHLMVPNIYPYTDLFYSSNSQGSKYYFILKPGADPKNIALDFRGADSTGISGDSLIITSALGSWSFKNPQIYNVSVSLPSFALSTTLPTGTTGWKLLSANLYGFDVGTYNTSMPLVIEFDMGQKPPGGNPPATINGKWSTYVGSSGYDAAYNSKHDAQDNLYVVGVTTSLYFPSAGFNVPHPNAFGSIDGFVDKYNSQGLRLWSTFVGGAEEDYLTSVDVAPNGDVYAVGHTNSDGIVCHTKPGTGVLNDNTLAFAPGIGGLHDLMIFQVTSTGNQEQWLTYYGGSWDETGARCKFDANGNFFIVGTTSSKDLAPVGSAPQELHYGSDAGNTNTDGFIVKFNTSSVITWATCFGSHTDASNSSILSANDGLTGLDFNSNNDLIVVGYSEGSDFPVTGGTYATKNSHYSEPYTSSDAVISRFTNSGQLQWSTCIGGEKPDEFNGVKIKGQNIYAVGASYNGTSFPLNNSYNWVYQPSSSPSHENVMFCVFDATQDYLSHATVLDGSYDNIGSDVDVDASDVVYISGKTQSSSFPTPLTQAANTYIESYQGLDDNFIYATAPGSTDLVWATCVAGSAEEGYSSYDYGCQISINSLNRLQLVSATKSDQNTQFPLWPGVANVSYFDGTYNGSYDASITEFDLHPINLLNTGVKEQKADELAEFSVYPNPTQKRITVKLQTSNPTVFYYIYNTAGQQVKQGSMQAQDKYIELSSLPAGMYVLDVKDNEKQSSIKFIKNE